MRLSAPVTCALSLAFALSACQSADKPTLPVGLEEMPSWMPTIAWEEPSRQMYAHIMHLDETRIIPAGVMEGVVLTTRDAGVDAYRTAITEGLQAAGWLVDQRFEASDGVQTQWGYSRREGNSQFVLIISQDEYESRIFISDPITDKLVMKRL